MANRPEGDRTERHESSQGQAGFNGGDLLTNAKEVRAAMAAARTSDGTASLPASEVAAATNNLPYHDRIPGLTADGTRHGLKEQSRTTNEDGSETVSSKGQLKDGYIWDTKIQAHDVTMKDGQVQSVHIKYSDGQNIKLGDNIYEHGVANLKGVTELKMTKDEDGGYTINVKPNQGSLITSQIYNTVKLSADGSIEGTQLVGK